MTLAVPLPAGADGADGAARALDADPSLTLHVDLWDEDAKANGGRTRVGPGENDDHLGRASLPWSALDGPASSPRACMRASLSLIHAPRRACAGWLV